MPRMPQELFSVQFSALQLSNCSSRHPEVSVTQHKPNVCTYKKMFAHPQRSARTVHWACSCYGLLCQEGKTFTHEE